MQNQNVAVDDLINGVQCVQKTLSLLERSLHKTSKYEQKRIQCKNSHRHSHDSHECWDSAPSVQKSSNCFNTHNSCTSGSSQSEVTESESRSTMSIVCLQYKYEELSKRYEALLQAYEDQCRAVSIREMRLAQWRQRANLTHTQLAHAHKSLLAVGEKYLSLRRKRNDLKNLYEERLNYMKEILHDIVEVTARELLRFDAKFSYCMTSERNSDAVLLLYEIRKCNLLFLENMRLKSIIEELLPGQVNFY